MREIKKRGTVDISHQMSYQNEENPSSIILPFALLPLSCDLLLTSPEGRPVEGSRGRWP